MIILISVIFAFCCAMYDTGKRFNSHISRWVFRAVVAIIVSYFVGDDTFYNLALFSTTFYMCFDGMLNLFEKRDFFYIGKTAIIDMVADMIFNKYVYFVFKVALWLFTYWIINF